MTDIRTPPPSIYGDFLTRFGETWKKQVELAKAKFGSNLEEVKLPPDYPTDVPIFYFKKDSIVDALRFFKEDPEFSYQFLSDITATDELPAKPRFEIVYNLLSHKNLARVRIKVRVAEGDQVPTATGVWEAANWPEREVWDMFGVKFKGHPDMRRILMDERWEGHPLRKDYPLRGYQVFTTPQSVKPELLEDKK